MKKRIRAIIIIIIFLAGLSLLLYPFIANEWNTYRQERLISNYETVVADKEEAGEIDYEAEKQVADAYNESLVPSVLPDSFAVAAASEEPDPEYMAALNIAGDGVMGVVEIPKIDISLPILHTTAEEVLEKAAGHLEGSSLPVGGESTHTVITAHRGLPSAALFTDLDKLDEGDHFLIHVLDETLCYEVDQIITVEPDQTDALSVEEGEDLATLITCTPYGVNTHRLMVRGHRVPYVPEEVSQESVPITDMSFHTSYLFWVIIGLAVTGLFVFFLYSREKKAKRAKESSVHKDRSSRKEQQ
jgi:sortase A